jgi:hypothetical protein
LFFVRRTEKPQVMCLPALVTSLDVALDGGRLGGRFAKLWTASATSALGSGLATIAVPLLVASRTNNPLLLAKDRLHIGSVGYGLLFTCSAVGGVLGSAAGDRI